MAHMKKTQFGKVDLDYVLGVGGFDLERFFSISIYLLLHLDICNFERVIHDMFFFIKFSFHFPSLFSLLLLSSNVFCPFSCFLVVMVLMDLYEMLRIQLEIIQETVQKRKKRESL